jgi:predicted pyridoxine 5'-phosphate oxidase superfamily flavin-nucleotide-binding protein
MVRARLGEPALKMLKGALVIKVEEIYSLTPGPEAGKRIA